MKIKLISFLMICGLFLGCATTGVNINEIPVPPVLNFEQTPVYENDTVQMDTKLKEASSKIEFLYGKKSEDGKIELTDDKSSADMVLMTPETFVSVTDIFNLTNSYKEVVKAQGQLVNSYISNINSLKNLSVLERQKLIISVENWKNSESMYKSEHSIRLHEMIINKIQLFGTIVGGVFLLGMGGL